MSEIKEVYTRISAISSAYAGYGSIPKAILDKAACRGSQVHRLIQSHTNNIVIGDDEMMFMGTSLAGYFASFLQFWQGYSDNEGEWEGFHDSKILLQEERIDDDELMITGEPDLVVERNGKLILIDWKATAAVGKHWQIQAEGYSYLLGMIKDIPVEKILFVRLQKEGSVPEVVEYHPDWEQVFLPAYRLYKMFMENNKINLEME